MTISSKEPDLLVVLGLDISSKISVGFGCVRESRQKEMNDVVGLFVDVDDEVGVPMSRTWGDGALLVRVEGVAGFDCVVFVEATNLIIVLVARYLGCFASLAFNAGFEVGQRYFVGKTVDYFPMAELLDSSWVDVAEDSM